MACTRYWQGCLTAVLYEYAKTLESVLNDTQINLTEFVTLPVEDQRDLYVIIANWQCFQSWGVYVIYDPAQWVTLHDTLVCFKVDVVH